MLARFITGLPGEAERESVTSRLQTDTAFRAEFDRLTLLWEQAGRALRYPLTGEQIDHAWGRLAASMDTVGQDRNGAPAVAPTQRLRPPPSTWLRRSRVLLATAALGLGIVGLVQLERYFGARSEAVASREILAPRGQRLALSLEDGTTVTLAPGSRLTVPTSFNEESRSVTLEGRAYFAVTSDTARAFLVNARGSVTRVLGTEFEISAYDDALTEVIVRSGRVEIRSSQEMNTPAKVLTPGDHARFNIGGEITVESGVDADALLAWTEGRLAFHGEHFAQVVPELERWFDLEIQLEDESLAERRLTAVFTDEPLDVVLETLGALIGATVERDGKRVTFTPAR